MSWLSGYFEEFDRVSLQMVFKKIEWSFEFLENGCPQGRSLASFHKRFNMNLETQLRGQVNQLKSLITMIQPHNIHLYVNLARMAINTPV